MFNIGDMVELVERNEFEDVDPSIGTRGIVVDVAPLFWYNNIVQVQWERGTTRRLDGQVGQCGIQDRWNVAIERIRLVGVDR